MDQGTTTVSRHRVCPLLTDITVISLYTISKRLPRCCNFLSVSPSSCLELSAASCTLYAAAAVSPASLTAVTGPGGPWSSLSLPVSPVTTSLAIASLDFLTCDAAPVCELKMISSALFTATRDGGPVKRWCAGFVLSGVCPSARTKLPTSGPTNLAITASPRRGGQNPHRVQCFLGRKIPHLSSTSICSAVFVWRRRMTDLQTYHARIIDQNSPYLMHSTRPNNYCTECMVEHNLTEIMRCDEC